MDEEKKNQRCGIILDGYTLDQTIPESEFHPEVEITFRPLSKVQVADMLGRIAKHYENPAKGEEIAAEILANQVKAWSLLDHNGNSVPINKEMMKALEPHLSAEIFDLVRGQAATIKRDEDLKN